VAYAAVFAVVAIAAVGLCLDAMEKIGTVKNEASINLDLAEL
jgi:hypothetical protein